MNTYEMVLFTDDMAANREELADGVAGVTCTYVGKIEDSPMIPAVRWLVADTAPALGVGYLSSVESFENGAHNVRVRDHHTDKVMGFVRVRPALPPAA